MNVKRIVMILVALLAVAGLMVSCGLGGKAGGKVVVKTMAYGDNSNPEGVNWVRIVDAFEKANPNIDIDYELLYDEAYHQKVPARLAAGDVPHLAYMGADARWGKPWKEANQQWDHKPYLDKNHYDLNLISPQGPKGEIWEVPLQTDNMTTILFANKPLIESLGFALPKTYEDMVAMVPKAKAAGLEVVTIDGADGWAWGSCYMSAIIARLSGDANWVQNAVAGKNKFTDQVFVDSLALIQRMIKDGVISEKSVLVDYGANLAAYSNQKALFMVQGHWVAGSIDPTVAQNSILMAWPKLPGEKGNAGSIAAAISVGYGVTQAGAKDSAVRDAALKFVQYFYSQEECTQRLRDGGIIAPVIQNFVVPDDMPSFVKQKVVLAKTAKMTDVIDAYLGGAPNDALNAGMQKIASGSAQPAEVAAEVEKLLRP